MKKMFWYCPPCKEVETVDEDGQLDVLCPSCRQIMDYAGWYLSE